MPKGVKIKKSIKKPRTKTSKKKVKTKKIDLKSVSEQVIPERDVRKEIEVLIKKERDKRLILWTGVTFFMVLIFGFWVMNLNKVFTKVENNSVEEFNWEEITENFSNTIDQMKDDLSEVRNFPENEISTTTKIGLPVQSDNINQDEISELRKRLEELEGKVDNPFEPNSSTSTSANEINQL